MYFGCAWSSLQHVGSLLLCAGSFSCGMQAHSCDMWTLSCSMHLGSSSPTRDQTWGPCVGSGESYPLDHQGGPYCLSLMSPFSFMGSAHILFVSSHKKMSLNFFPCISFLISPECGAWKSKCTLMIWN